MSSSVTLVSFLSLLLIAVGGLQAEDWKKVTSKDGKLSAMFPEDIAEEPKTQVDRTLAGKVTSYFGEYYGDGILLAGSGADIPGLARAAGEDRVFNESKKTFLKQAKGTELSFTKSEVKGAPARILTYKGDAYQGKGDPYEGKAILLIVNKRMYILNAVISKDNAENQAAAEKLFNSIEVSG